MAMLFQLCFSFTEMVPASGNALGSIVQTFVRSVRNIHYSSAYSFLCYTRKIYYFHKWNTFSKISTCITYECWPLNISLQYADPCLSELNWSLSSLYHSFFLPNFVPLSEKFCHFFILSLLLFFILFCSSVWEILSPFPPFFIFHFFCQLLFLCLWNYVTLFPFFILLFLCQRFLLCLRKSVTLLFFLYFYFCLSTCVPLSDYLYYLSFSF